MSVGASIRRLRKAKGMTILELATLAGSDVGNLSRLERGVQGYSQDTLENLSAALGVTVAELFATEANVDDLTIRGRVPLVSWVAAGNWCTVADSYPVEDAEEWLACPVRHGIHTYALRVKGDSMHNPNGKPSFDDGDIIFVDPDSRATHRSLVIARLDDENQATFKRLLIENEIKMLEALNPSWPNRIIQVNGNATICGVVIARLESFL